MAAARNCLGRDDGNILYDDYAGRGVRNVWGIRCSAADCNEAGDDGH